MSAGSGIAAINWEKAHELYENYRARTRIFELYPLTLSQFRERYANNILPFFDVKSMDGFVIYTQEGKTAVIRFVVTSAVLTDEDRAKLLIFIENTFNRFSKILYFVTSEDLTANSFFKKIGYAAGLKRPRLLTEVKRLNASQALPAGFTLRKYAVPGDRRSFAEIMNATFKDVWNHEDITIERVAHWDQDAAFDPAGYLFLEHENKTVGFLAISAEHEVSMRGHVCVLHEIGVIPDYRNKNLATALLAQAAVFARKKGADIIFLTVDEKNEKALRFYSRAGFEKIYEMNTYLKQTA